MGQKFSLPDTPLLRYHWLCAMSDPCAEPANSRDMTSNPADSRREDLGSRLRPVFLIASGLTCLQLIFDLIRDGTPPPLSMAIWATIILVPLLSAALTNSPVARRHPELLAFATDIFFTLAILSSLLAPGVDLSTTAISICLKLLATAILLPWSPLQQDLSGLITNTLYLGIVWASGFHIEETHQVVAPFLAALLASAGCRSSSRADYQLARHSREIEASQARLRLALDHERVLLSIANQTSRLADMHSTLESLTKATSESTGSDFSAVFTVDDDAITLASIHSKSANRSVAVGSQFPGWKGSRIESAVSLGDTIVINDIHNQDLFPLHYLEESNVRCLAFSPIRSGGEVRGVLAAGMLEGSSAEYDIHHRSLMTGIAAHAAVTINNTRLYDDLTQSEAAYRDLFERATDLIFVADSGGGIRFANHAALTFFSIDAGSIHDVSWTRYLADREIALLKRLGQWARRRSGASGNPFEVRVNLPNGNEATLEIRTRSISPPGQDPALFQCIARDVTERRRRDEETRALLMRLQESNRLQDEFVANMSHELRTPLNVIIGYADLISEEIDMPINSDARSFLDRISAASRALHRMVESILEYARLDRGRMMVIPTNFSSDHLLLELRGLCNDVRSTVDVSLDIQQDGRVDFATDYDRLFSVLSNLMLNALKFTPRGTVSLRVLAHDDHATFIVRDTGIGIEPNELRSVFEPFRQADGSDTRTFGGVGLGLAIVRRNVDLLRGTIDVDSTPQEGTTFSVRIPIELEGAARSAA